MCRIPTIACALFLLAGELAVRGQNGRPNGNHGHPMPSGTNYFNVAVPAHDYDLIIARPEDRSVTLSILAYRDLEGFVTFGMPSGAGTNRTSIRRFTPGVPLELVLGRLQADAKYFLTFHFRTAGTTEFSAGPEFSFHTARPPGSTFTFTLTADSHLDEHTRPEVYRQTLAHIRAEQPDFNIDLGNLFMTDKHETRAEAAQQYLAQRYYLGQLGAPLFLALGVHDGECSKDDDGTPNCLAAWSGALRKRYFPDPVPDAFFTGNSTPAGPGGLREDYFAWTWGDALFVVLDPYRDSIPQRGRNSDGWAWSLGREQYDWLARTLAASRAKFKFIFIHNLLSGDRNSRGGVEIAGFNEWGGKNLDGTDGFALHRPGWPMPIHQLLLKNHVNAVFKAHDNFYARQELDGIVYLMVPQPSFAGNDRIRDLQAYGYQEGVFLGNSGFVRVTVEVDKTTVSYVKTAPDTPVADSCTVLAK